tara:strand:+ start:48 stop:2048 length:2001 start_codon:yes stop_codon:yes gene_type:complete
MTILVTKNSVTPKKEPDAGSLSLGELAINVVDKKLYVGDASGNPVTLSYERDLSEVFLNKPEGEPIVMTWVGNSNTGGILTKEPDVPLVYNPNVYVWQATATNTHTAEWRVADHSSTPYGQPRPIGEDSSGNNDGLRMVGYCGGQRGSPALAAADAMQRMYGGIVFLIVTYQGGAPSALVHPGLSDARGSIDANADSTYNIFGVTPVLANNLWWWHSITVNQALASIRTGSSETITDGLTTPAIPAYPNITHVDFVGDTLGQGDALYTASYTGSIWTNKEAEVNYVANMTAFVRAAEGTTLDSTRSSPTTNGNVIAIANGGWAKAQYTRWFSMDMPAGSQLDGRTGSPLTGVAIGQAWLDFDGLALYARVASNLYRSIAVPDGQITPYATGSAGARVQDVYGTEDGIHPNTISNIAIGTYASRVCVETPNSAPRSVDTTLDAFTQNVDGAGFNLTGVGDLGATGTSTLTNLIATGTSKLTAASGTINDTAYTTTDQAFVFADSLGNLSQGPRSTTGVIQNSFTTITSGAGTQIIIVDALTIPFSSTDTRMLLGTLTIETRGPFAAASGSPRANEYGGIVRYDVTVQYVSVFGTLNKPTATFSDPYGYTATAMALAPHPVLGIKTPLSSTEVVLTLDDQRRTATTPANLIGTAYHRVTFTYNDISTI